MLYKICGLYPSLWRTLVEKTALHLSQGTRVFVLVPEQFTLVMERRLMQSLDLPGFFDLEVLSPTRLCSRVFGLAGRDRRTRIDTCGRQMAISRVLKEKKPSLQFYAASADSIGLAQKMGTLITQLKQSRRTPADVQLYAGSREDAERMKWQDIALIYDGYEELLRGRFMDSSDEMQDMLFRLKDSRLMQNAAVFVYGFDMITEQLRYLLAMLAEAAQTVYLLTVLQNATALFEPVKKSLNRVAGEELEPLPTRSLVSPDLEHLSKDFCSDFPAAYDGKVENIRYDELPSPYAQLHQVAARILEHHRAGIPFENMAVAMGVDETVAFRAVMKEYDIPVYIQEKLPASAHGASVFCISALRCLEKWDPEEVFTLLHSGFAPLQDSENFEFENYCLKYGMRGNRFLRTLERGTAEEIGRMEAVKQKLMSPFEALRSTLLPEAPVRDALSALYRFLKDCNVPQRLNAVTERLERMGLPERAVQTARVWDTLMQLFDETDALLDGTLCTPGDLADILEAGLKEKKLASLPPSEGSLNGGLIGNMPLSNVRILFACGLNEAMMNAAPPDLLSDTERSDFEEVNKVHLSLSGREQDAMRQLDLWKCFCAASEKLYLSCPLASQDGRALGRVSSINTLTKLFGHLPGESTVQMHQCAQHPRAPLAALAALGIRLRGQADQDMTPEWQQAWAWLNEADETKAAAESLKKAFRPEENQALPRDTARQLMLERNISITRLESYASCPFRHFADHGLKPKDREEWKMDARGIGNFYHDAMERFTASLKNIPSWPDITRATCDEAVDRVAQPLLDDLIRMGPMGDFARLRRTGEKYRKAVKRVAWAFTRTACNSEFRTKDQEVSFGTGEDDSLAALPIKLKDGSIVYLQGRIDRVDRYEGDEGLYLRVVDYKSSDKDLEAERIWWGTQLQLLLYMDTLLKNEPEALPAGVFYSHVFDPLLNEKEAKGDIELALAEKLHLKGLGLKDATVWQLMDNGEKPTSLPNPFDKAGNFKKTAKAASLDELKLLITHAENCAKDLAEAILSGRIDPSPLKDKTNDPCTYCRHAALCRRDPAHTKDREICSMQFDELYTALMTGEKRPQ